MTGFKSTWKQSNKSHSSGRHRSKRMVAVASQGRVNATVISKKKKQEIGRENRRNQAKQLRDKKRAEVLSMKRGVGKGNSCPPHMVVFIPLHHQVDVTQVTDYIESCSKLEDRKVIFSEDTAAGFTVNFPRFKHRYQFITPPSASLPLYLDYTRMADTVVFVVNMSEDEPVDEEGIAVMKTLQASGLSSYVFCGQNLQSYPAKKRNAVKMETIKKLKTHFIEVKLQVVENEQETFSLLRLVSECRRKKLKVWSKRSLVLGEKVEFKNDNLAVSGYVRNNDMDANKLIHVVGWGEFRIKSLKVIAEPCPYSIQRNKIEDRKTRVGDKVYDPYECMREVTIDENKQETLKREADVDPMDAEQTFPTEEEIREAQQEAERLRNQKITLKKRSQKGASEYQSDWVMEDEGDWQKCDDDEYVSGDDDEYDDDDDEMCDEDEELDDEFLPLDVDTQSQMNDDKKSVTFSTAPTESVLLEAGIEDKFDEEDLMRYRDERSHEMFPDEVDTPMHIPASVRFQKYRGLQSFRTSAWDIYENLPQDYGRLFRINRFNEVAKLVKQEHVDEENLVKCGSFVTIELADVDRAMFEKWKEQNQPLTMFSLFKYEQKMSVLNFAIKKIKADVSIKSKDSLTFHLGFRKFSAAPIFSEHTTGNKHKMIRYMPNNAVCVATVYGPVTFPPANVLVYKDGREDEGPVAIGTLYDVNANRAIIKRVVLSGHPFKSNKKSAVVRYMFFNPDDVRWFRQIELRTKLGRRGHIKYPVGTHGLMKCKFNEQVTSNDTVLMNIYKRVYPKWTYQQLTPLDDPSSSSAQPSQEVEMME